MGRPSALLTALVVALAVAAVAAEHPIDHRFATARAETLLAVPPTGHQALAAPDGGLRLADGTSLGIAPMAPFAFSRKHRPVQRLLEGHLPIVLTSRQSDTLALELTTFAADNPHMACIRAVVRNKAARPAEPVLRIEARGTHGTFVGKHAGFRREGRIVALCELRQGKGQLLGAGKPTRNVFRRQGGRALPGWGHPKRPCDRGFRNIVAGFGEPATYLMKIEPGKRYLVAVGLCESHWTLRRKRICDILVEGKRVARIDPVAKPYGTDVPFVLTYPAADLDGDGWLAVTSVAAPGSPDVNSIVNVIWLFEESVGKPLSPADIVAGKANRLAHCYIDCGGRVDGPGPTTLDYRLSLPAGGSATLWVKAPFAPTKVADAPGLAAADPASLLAAAQKAWRDQLGRAAAIELGDPAPAHLLAASVANLLSLTKRDPDGLALLPGAFAAAAEPQAAALGGAALDRVGLHAEAALVLDHLLALRGDERLWKASPDPWNATGQALWAMLAHYQLTGDKAWLAAHYKPIAQAAQALIDATEHTKWVARDPALYFHGLVPASPYRTLPADYWLVHDLWAWHGIRCAAAAARALERPNDYKWLEDNLAEYGDTIRRAMARGSVVGPAAGCLPAAPGEAAQWTFAAALAALYPAPAVSADDKLLAATFRYLDAHAIEGLPGGLDGRSPAVDVALACHYALARLAAGHADAALKALASIANVAPATGALPERADLRARRASGMAPSAAAAAGYVLLLRDMLVRESAEELHLCSALPAAWLAKGIAAARAPTRFGPLSYRARLSPDGTKLVVEATIPTRPTPKAIVIALPRPARRATAAKATRGKATVAAGSVRVVGWAGQGKVEIDLH